MENNIKYQDDDDRMMDKMFRENLSDHQIEPSSGVWKSINRKLMWKELSHFNFTNLSRLSWIGGACVMVLITVTAYLFIRPGDPSSSTLSSKGIISIPITGSTSLNTPVTVPIANPVVEKSSPATAVSSSSVSQGIVLSLEEPIAEERLVTEYLESTPSETTLLAFMSSQPAPDLTDGVLTDTLRFPISGNGVLLILKDKIPTPNFYSASLSVLPELSIYNTTGSNSEVNYWMNVGASYHFSRFSVGTGISLGYVFDDGKYLIDYRSKDSIGYYESVVGFTVNPLNPNEISYTTELKNVYDSIQHIADDQTRNRYTYLQIPVLLGYRFMETQRLGITVLAGPAVSFLIGKREAKPYVDYPNARIIRIENNTPNRISTSWQLWLSMRIDYRINKMISVFAEPTYKYTFKAIEIPGEGTFSNANSIGLGIGLQFNFGKLNR